jgi:hypothetical protein
MTPPMNKLLTIKDLLAGSCSYGFLPIELEASGDATMAKICEEFIAPFAIYRWHSGESLNRVSNLVSQY